MSRLPRIILPGISHHVTQRGNRRQRIFMQDDDYALYRDWLAQACRSNGVEVWSYCLMPSHVHLILVPSDETGLSRAVGETHRRYSGYINARLRVTGHLFQGRFGCVAMDESHLMAAFRYVALNPVKAGCDSWCLALVQHASTSPARRRWLGYCSSPAGSRREFRGTLGDASRY
jgi:putative transposase